MPLSWNEIRQRAITFARDWSDASRERSDAQTFWNEFFEVFGIRRRTVASFEEPVRNLGGATDFIDLFWRGRLIAEHKSRGRDLGKAHTQANDYVQSLAREGRHDEIPRYILVSDFARFALHDLEESDPAKATIEFTLDQLPRRIRAFAFIAGYETRRLDAEDPANLKATALLANVHDRLEDGGYTGHDLQRFMVRILFCLFAEDTGIFEPDAFTNFLRHNTREDGSDLGAQLAWFFAILNTDYDQRQRNLPDDLVALPYVNGDLFAEQLRFASFDRPMRQAVLEATRFHWEKISPAVFGSLFQSIMEDRARRQIGAHYTSERDILKLIRSLFLDDLRAEFDKARRDKNALARFNRKLGELRFLDPACGCGNFLVIAYRELRQLEMDVLHARFGDTPDEADLRANAQLNVGQFYGIEIEEWPALIAEVAMWLMDHQMNSELFQRFGQAKPTTPLTRSPHIVQANALRIDWNDVLPADQCSYVLGNPPFVGSKYQTRAQRDDMAQIVEGVKGYGLLDFVTGWYFKAVDYIADLPIPVAFVSTNSICQGEQAGVLWTALFQRGVKIHFAHRTFAWASEARGKAHVHVVIVGWGKNEIPTKRLYDYETDEQTPTITEAKNISPYLVEGPPLAITNRSKPLCDVPEIKFGNQPIDGGHFILNAEEKAELLATHPEAIKYLRTYVGSREFLNGNPRWCLWLRNNNPAEIRSLHLIMQRIDGVRRFRLDSQRPATQALADIPTAFAFVSHTDDAYLLIPSVSSERRPYIPMGFMPPDVIASNLCLIVPNATLYDFGVLSSGMHMAWVRQVCGRLKSDYRYSGKLVYNNFPWPQDVTVKQRERVAVAGQGVLEARAKFGDATLADLYDPLAMPAALRKAHAVLDRAVDACYRRAPFTSERQRLEYLFGLYETLLTPLTPTKPKRRRRRSP